MTTADADSGQPPIKPGAIDARHDVSFGEVLKTWAKVGFLGFGGPAGQIALMHRIVVEEKKWLDEARFLHALNYCMLLPGPEAQQLAIYIGWLMHKTKGGLAAGILFVLPGAIIILALSMLYAGYHDLQAVEAAFFGIKAAVLAIVVAAVKRLAGRALANGIHAAIAVAAFIALFLFNLPFPLVILGAALIGLTGGSVARQKFATPVHGQDVPENISFDDQTPPSIAHAFRTIAIFGGLWFLPLVALALILGRDNIYFQEGVFFSKMAVVTFGGAYAVLAYVAQQAVNTYGWLMPGEMIDGLGLAETTPGPLIMVVQFVGFMGAFRHPGSLDPMLAGTLGALVTTWVTFAPCFLWIFLGAPYLEKLRGNQRLGAALSAITAAVVGVIVNLALWFALHFIFARTQTQSFLGLTRELPDWSSIDIAAALLSGAAIVAMIRFKAGMLITLAACAAIGAAYRLSLG